MKRSGILFISLLILTSLLGGCKSEKEKRDEEHKKWEEEQTKEAIQNLEKEIPEAWTDLLSKSKDRTTAFVNLMNLLKTNNKLSLTLLEECQTAIAEVNTTKVVDKSPTKADIIEFQNKQKKLNAATDKLLEVYSKEPDVRLIDNADNLQVELAKKNGALLNSTQVYRESVRTYNHLVGSEEKPNFEKNE